MLAKAGAKMIKRSASSCDRLTLRVPADCTIAEAIARIFREDGTAFERDGISLWDVLADNGTEYWEFRERGRGAVSYELTDGSVITIAGDGDAWKLSPAANCPGLPVNGKRNEG